MNVLSQWVQVSHDDHAYSPLHREGDEGQVFKFRDLGVIQRGEGLFLSCMQDLYVKCCDMRGSTH